MRMMLFSNPRSIDTNAFRQQQQQSATNAGAGADRMVMFMNQPPKPMLLSPPPSPPTVYAPTPTTFTQKEEEETALALKRMKWGNPIWTFFHVLSMKIKEESFPVVRVEILNIISNICHNLPCPDCATHATEYLNKNGFMNIRSKNELKSFLFMFHNFVNNRKHMPVLSHLELDPLYENKHFGFVFRTFLEHFKDKHKSIRMIADDFHRERMAQFITTWFQQNIGHFTL